MNPRRDRSRSPDRRRLLWQRKRRRQCRRWSRQHRSDAQYVGIGAPPAGIATYCRPLTAHVRVKPSSCENAGLPQNLAVDIMSAQAAVEHESGSCEHGREVRHAVLVAPQRLAGLHRNRIDAAGLILTGREAGDTRDIVAELRRRTAVCYRNTGSATDRRRSASPVRPSSPLAASKLQACRSCAVCR
jgi:hypothetical protein